MKRRTVWTAAVAALALAALASPAQAQILLSESFEVAIPVTPNGPPGTTITLPSGDWFAINESTPIGTTGVFTSTLFAPTPPGGGAQHLAMNFNSTAGTGTISTWMMSPVLNINNGDQISFFTQSPPGSTFPDRVRLQLSSNGASTATGDFTNVLLTINDGLVQGGYPGAWTQFTATVSGLGGPGTGRFAFHYDVTNGGPSGANSDFVGFDLVEYSAVPEPGSMALCGVAVAGLGWYRRRKVAA